VILLTLFIFVFVFVIQGFESNCDRVKKKGKKTKHVSETAEDGGLCGHSEVTDGVQNDNSHKRKSGKCKTFTKHAASEAENGINCSPEAGHPDGEKKKNAASLAVNGHKIKSKKSRDVIGAHEQTESKTDSVSANGDLNDIYVQQSDECLKSTSVDKKRKRKNKEEKNIKLNSPDNTPYVDDRCSKKLKTDLESESDKMVVSSGSVQPGAFENYRISQSLVDKLQCM